MMDKKACVRAVDIDYILRYRIIALIVLLGLTVFFAVQLRDLKMASDPLEAMYPQGHKYISTLHAIKKFVPESHMLVCVLDVGTGDIYNKETLAKIDSLTKGIMGIEGVLPTGITSLTKGITHYNNTADGLEMNSILGYKWPQTSEEFEALKRRVAVNPMGIGKYFAYDNTAVMITAKLCDINQLAKTSYDQIPDKEKVSFEKYRNQQANVFNANLLKNMRELKSKIDDNNHTLYFMGQEILTAQMTEMGKTHISIAACLMVVITIIMLALYFKTVSGIVVPILAMIMSVLWTLGMYSMKGIELNPMALLFPMILGIMPVALSVLVMLRYYRSYDEFKDKYRAIIGAYEGTLVIPATLTAGLVTATMCVSNVPMLKDLGYMGLFSIVGMFAAVVFLVPVLISFLPAPLKKGLGVGEKIAHVFIRPSIGRWRWGILVVLAVILIIGALSAARLKIGGNVPGISYIRSDHPWRMCFNLLEEKFMGPNQLLVYVKANEEGGLLEPASINAMGDFSSYLRNESGAKDSITFDMMICLTRGSLMGANPKWQTVPLSRNQISGLAGMVMEEGGAEDFMNPTFTQATISPFFPTSDTKSIDRYASNMQAYIDSHPSENLSFSLGGGLLGMTKALNDGTRDAYPLVLIAGFIGLLVLVTLATGSLINGLIITIPVALAQGIIWLIMVIFDIPVNLPVVSVASAAIGFGCVFGYHLLSRMSGEDLGKAGGEILLTGLFVFVACLPWFFIGMTFQADMVMMFGIMALTETSMSLMFIPALARCFMPGFQDQ